MPSRIIVRLEITPDAKQQVEKACDALGMKQVALLSRVMEWFARQDATTQRMIVGHIPPELGKSLARLAFPNKSPRNKTRS
jgi:hypothetical protein